MTLKDAIVKFDAECRNNIPTELKINWISHLDSAIHREIILTHENSENVIFSGYTIDTPEDTVLLVPEPYSDIYPRFLAMKSDLYHSDITRYNNDLVMYSAAYLDFENYYNRTYLPIKRTIFFNA